MDRTKGAFVQQKEVEPWEKDRSFHEVRGEEAQVLTQPKKGGG